MVELIRTEGHSGQGTITEFLDRATQCIILYYKEGE